MIRLRDPQTALAAAELATYDELKEALMGTGFFSPGLGERRTGLGQAGLG